jgi:hypothetical protein
MSAYRPIQSHYLNICLAVLYIADHMTECEGLNGVRRNYINESDISATVCWYISLVSQNLENNASFYTSQQDYGMYRKYGTD